MTLQLTRRSLLLIALSAMLPRPASALSSTDEFVDSVGVNVHLSGKPYSSRYDQFRELIAASGIRHLRDELRPVNDLARWRELCDIYGIRSHLLVSPTTNTVEQMLEYLDALGVHRVSAIEGQNEPDSDWFMAHPAAGADWAATAVAYQRAVFLALRERYAPADLPILSPSILDWKPADVRRIADAKDYCDIVSIHSYVQHAQEPETSDEYAGLDWYVHHMADAFKPGVPVMTTETGYHNAVQPRGRGISEAAAAKYIPRLLLNSYASGIARTFLYEFMDSGSDPSDSEHNYGLIRHDGTPKPAYHAVRSLLHAMRGASRVRSPANADVNAWLQDPPTQARSLTLNRHDDGSILIPIWRAMKSWDAEQRADIAVPVVPTALRLSRPVRNALWIAPGIDATWTQVPVVDAMITLPVSDRVIVVRLEI